MAMIADGGAATILGEIGLVLEGGGMRGAYTAGVLDFFLDAGIDFPLVTAASSSALLGSYFLTKQKGTNLKIFKELMRNRETISFKRMLTHKELFSMDFIFGQIPKNLVPFDFQTFSNSKTRILIGTTEVATGKTRYYEKFETVDDLFTVVRASCSLPVLAPFVSYQGKDLLDGGMSDPLPIRPALDNGYTKNVVILTRNKGYVKRPTKLNWFYKLVFKNFPELRQLLRDRHNIYNQTMDLLHELERQGKVLMIRPEKPLVAKRIERNEQILQDLYQQGYREAEQKKEALLRFADR